MLFSNAASFLTKLILARLLVPEYFGLVAMAVVFTGLIQHIEALGLKKALIQRPEDDLSPTDLYTGHLTTILCGIAFYFLVILPGTPIVAWFYDEPQLIAIIPVLAIPVLLNPFVTHHRVTLKRQLRFPELAKIKIAATFTGAITAVVLAFGGAGVWAIVAQWIISGAVTVAVLRWIYTGPPEANYSWSSARRLLGYGLNETGHKVFTFVYKHADYLIVGRMVGAASLGAYSLAFLLTDSIRQKLMSVLRKVLFPTFSKIQDDLAQINTYYLSTIRFNTIIVMPIIAAFVVFPEPLVIHGFGPEWIKAIEPLRFLAIAALVHTIGGSNASILKALGRPDLPFKQTALVSTLVLIPGLFMGLHFYGLVGAAAAVIVSKLVSRMWYHYWLRKLIGTREPDILKAIGPSMLGGILMGGVLAAAKEFLVINDLFQTILVLTVASLMFCLVVLPLVIDDMQTLWNSRQQ